MPVVADMSTRIRGAARGLAAGAVAGLVWCALEAVLGWASGSVVPRAILERLVAANFAVSLVVGIMAGLLAPRVGLRTLALVLAGVYGLLRVYAPPGYGAETIYVVAFAAVGAIALRVAGSHTTWTGLGLTIGLGALGVLLGDTWLEAHHAGALRGMLLPFGIVGFVWGPLLADALVSLVLRGPALRAGVLAATGAVVLLATAKPLDIAPRIEDVVTGVPPPAGTPDVILVSMDTTRADHLSTYGYARETSPHLSEIAADALLFTQARSSAGWTLPAHASMLTGLYPSAHGAHLAGGWLAGQSIDGRRNVAYPLAADRTTLAEALRDRGYQTAGFVANFSYLYRDYGLAQGFGRYDDAPGLLFRVRPPVIRLVRTFTPGFALKPCRTARDINAAALSWLDGAPAGRPVFLFLNYMEPHQPWMAEAPYDRWVWEQRKAARLAQQDLYTHEIKHFTPDELGFIVASYDGQVAAMDAALGELVTALKARGRYEDALVVVTADHGEMLGEHETVGHMGRMLYEPLVHVPLVVKFPGAGRPRGRDDRPVQIVDVTPTVLARAGAPMIPGMQGQSLPDVTHPMRAEEDINPFLVSSYGPAYDRAVRVVYDGSYKLITTSRGDRMLFDLARDPGETENLAEREGVRLADLTRRLEAVFGTTVAANPGPQQVN
jgi:arylsulfatase A-like enzyme